MATYNGSFKGKLGRIVGYKLNGKDVAREIGISYKEPTLKQKANWQKTAVTSALLNPVLEFINLGFELKAKAVGKNAHNMASSYNKLYAVTGIYPDQQIDFTKVLFSQGDMPVANNTAVRITETGLEFSWEADQRTKGTHWSDHVMLLAYFPDLKRAVYLSSGAKRYQGVEQLPLSKIKGSNIVETYIAFIQDTHKSVSDSIYLGRLVWEGGN